MVGRAPEKETNPDRLHFSCPSTDAGGIYGWLWEVGGAGDFERACDAFKKAQAIVDRLAGV
jgi:hypothetical protein